MVGRVYLDAWAGAFRLWETWGRIKTTVPTARPSLAEEKGISIAAGSMERNSERVTGFWNPQRIVSTHSDDCFRSTTTPTAGRRAV